LGLVDNMAGLVCPNCGKRDDLFGERSPESLVQELGVGLLAELPLYPEIRIACDQGKPLVLSDPQHPASRTYLELAASVSRAVEQTRSDMHGPEPTKVEHDSASARVKISWSDGVETSYSLSGLRGWCPCAQCQGHSGAIAFAQPEGEVGLDSFEGVGRYAVRFLWKDGHSTGMYSYAWLREIADSPECR